MLIYYIIPAAVAITVHDWFIPARKRGFSTIFILYIGYGVLVYIITRGVLHFLQGILPAKMLTIPMLKTPIDYRVLIVGFAVVPVIIGALTGIASKWLSHWSKNISFVRKNDIHIEKNNTQTIHRKAKQTKKTAKPKPEKAPELWQNRSNNPQTINTRAQGTTISKPEKIPESWPPQNNRSKSNSEVGKGIQGTTISKPEKVPESWPPQNVGSVPHKKKH